MSSPTITPLFPTSGFGEGPHWCSERNELLFVDVFKPQYVHKYNPKTKLHKKVRLDFGDKFLSVVIPVSHKHNEFIVSSGDNLYKLIWDGESELPTELKSFASLHEGQVPTPFLNDGKCDKNGRLWIGSVGAMKSNELMDIYLGEGKLFSLEKDLSIVTHLDGINVSNGITWSPNYKEMYYVDSHNHKVDAFDYDVTTGNITNRRTIFDFKCSGTIGMPDGMTTDEDGNIWLACFQGSQVLCIDPSTGELKRSIKFPVSQVTSCIFGGPNLDILYVTSGNRKIGDEVNGEYAGYLFEVTGLGVKGIPSVPFGGKLP